MTKQKKQKHNDSVLVKCPDCKAELVFYPKDGIKFFLNPPPMKGYACTECGTSVSSQGIAFILGYRNLLPLWKNNKWKNFLKEENHPS